MRTDPDPPARGYPEGAHDPLGAAGQAPPVGGPVLACVDDGPDAAKVVQAAFRLADRSGVPWTVLHVDTPAIGLRRGARTDFGNALALAESLGAGIATVIGESDVASDVLRFAQERQFARIVVGWRRRGPLTRLRRADTVDRLLRGMPHGIELTVVAGPEPSGGLRPASGRKSGISFNLRPFLWALAAVAVAGFLAYGVEHAVPLANLSLLFLTAVLLIGARFGTTPALFAAAASLAVYNFFFTEPYYTFFVHYESDILTLGFFVLAAALAGPLAGRFRAQLEAVRVAARRNAVLYDFSRRVAVAAELDDVLWAVCHHVAAAFKARSVVLLPEADQPDGLAIKAGYPPEDRLSDSDWAAARWSWRERRPAGRGLKEHPTADHLFVPLQTRRGAIGLIGVAFDKDSGLRSISEMEWLIDAVANQSAIAIERAQLSRELQEARVRSETENLRSALLSSISHDLRTPLVSVIGSATTLKVLADEVPAPDRLELIDTILEEAQRLNRFVQNLLDMTRLGHGAVQPRRDWTDLREVVGLSIHRLRDTLSQFRVRVALDPETPLLYIDPVLMEQVFVNLLDNAVKYSPPGGEIAIAGGPITGAVEISVTDEGPGVPEAERARVFEMFYRVKSADRDECGTGLGLAICKGLVEAHGGQIRIEAGPGRRGSAILIRLPIETTPTEFGEDADEEEE